MYVGTVVTAGARIDAHARGSVWIQFIGTTAQSAPTRLHREGAFASGATDTFTVHTLLLGELKSLTLMHGNAWGDGAVFAPSKAVGGGAHRRTDEAAVEGQLLYSSWCQPARRCAASTNLKAHARARVCAYVHMQAREACHRAARTLSPRVYIRV